MMDSSRKDEIEDSSLDKESECSMINSNSINSVLQVVSAASISSNSEDLIGELHENLNNNQEDPDRNQAQNCLVDSMGNPEESENVTELIVLDPDHHLMKRFQNALKDMLTKKLTTVQLEEKELNETIKKRSAEYTELGNTVFVEQSELSQFQSKLVDLNNEYENSKIQRQEKEKELAEVKLKAIECRKELEVEYEKMKNLRNDLDNMALRLFYLLKAQSEIKGDVAIMKRATEKAVEDLNQAEKGKMNQDLVVDKLMTEADKLKEDIELLEAQLVAQEDEKCAVKQTLHEAGSEVQAVVLERKKIHNQWNSTLHDVTSRNEALNTLNEALNEIRELILVKQNEIDGLQRIARERQEVNEKLELIKKKSRLDYSNAKRRIENCEKKVDLLKENYDKQVLVLNEVDAMFAKINEDKKAELSISNSFETDMQYLTKMKHEYEEKIDELLRTKMTLDSAKTMTKKLVKNTRDQTREVEFKLVLLDHKLSKDGLRVAELKTEIAEAAKHQVQLDKEIDEANSIMNKLECDKHKNSINIHNRQTLIEQLNKRYSELLKDRGGVALSPLEAMIHHLNKSISLATDETSSLEQKWLRQQHEIIQLMEEKEQLDEDIGVLKQKFLLLEQRKLRYAGYMEIEEKERRDIQKELNQIQNSMFRINAMIDKEGKSRMFKEHDLGISETDLERELKEEEQATIEMQSKMDELDREKNVYLQNILEIEWQIMTYEKKMAMLEEAKATVKSDVGQGEILSMKSEIHRMEQRYKLMKQQQEKLIQEMENCVAKRDFAMTRKDSLAKITDKVTTKIDVEKSLIRIKCKTAELKKEENESLIKTVELRKELEDLEIKLVDQRELLEVVHKRSMNYEIEIKVFKEKKYELFMQLQKTQNMCKMLGSLKTGKQKKVILNAQTMSYNKDKCSERLQNLIVVVQRLISEYPQVQENMYPIYHVMMKSFQELK